MAALIRRGIDADTIPAQDPDFATAAVIGVSAETFVSPLWPVAAPPRSEDALVHASVTRCLRVIGLPVGG